ncbi:hypothetical protein OH802_06500 [Nocardioides sp. NBC_00850]|uniref:SDH family Clp fold serine proteinase n=1 Tax=Nocardioides sp. NBC_00850 TaxID=2976001 RepID=UPI003868C1C0|nr:hypothetical protein OH802_06500 [Nocardioides sp. NBC_00850]
MPSWNDLLAEFSSTPDPQKSQWIEDRRAEFFGGVSRHQGGRNVIFYGAAFLQKQAPAPMVSITHEDINGFMSVIYGMDWSKGLTLLLHTPGGNPNAAQTIVEYLRSKFASVEVIVPALAMSAGTMISLASDKITMGRQSQLGPIDPQLTVGGRTMSARGVVDQFTRASAEILKNPAAAHVWAPITQSLGPALLADAQAALDYSETMVAEWLSRWMFSGGADAVAKGKAVAKHFNDASTHKSHGRRIDLAEAVAQGLTVERLEDDQPLQELVLSVYHLMTILFEHSPATKLIMGSNGHNWMKNLAPGAAA